ncbi:MAG: helix-turn-helix domain-containing protein [Culicoidibacterales bacterium]
MNKKKQQSIGALLQRIRLAKNLPQEFLCEGIMSQSMLSRIESDISIPTFTKLHQLLIRMQISFSEFDFLLTQKHPSSQMTYNNSVENALRKLDAPMLQTLFDIKQGKLPEHTYDILNWFNYCFSIQFSNITLSPSNNSQIMMMLNQDEFFHKDISKLIFGLIYLEYETAYYCAQRIKAQIYTHQTIEISPHLIIDTILTISIMALKLKGTDESIVLLYEALTLAKSFETVDRMIIVQLLLYNITGKVSYLNDATFLKKAFSKDIYFKYWYNVLYTKYSIEVRK